MDGRYDVIVSGYLFDVTIPRKNTESGNQPMVPVGYEEYLEMRSLDFEEFLWANGITQDIIDEVRFCIHDHTRIGEVFLNRFNDLFKDFMIIGGMPEAVQRFVEDRNYEIPGTIIGHLLDSCRLDINQYNSGTDSIKTRECFESIPDQLSSSNKKFMYSRINGTGSRRSAEKYMGNLMWIKGSGIGNFVYGLDAVASPIRGNSKRNHFRVYMSDTGLLMHMYGEGAMRAIYRGDNSYNMGAIAENIVAECIVKSGSTPYYYLKTKGEDRMELDFVVELPSGLVVVEVKSGKSRDCASLEKVPGYYRVEQRILLGDTNVNEREDGILECPLFAAAFFDEFDRDWDGPRF